MLRRLEATASVALLRDECMQTRLLFGDAPLGGTDLLAQRVADADRRAASLLHRRRLKPRFLGTFRSGVVRVDRHLLAPLGRREDVRSGVPRRRRDLAVTRQLFATGEELGTLALDRGSAGLACADEIADVRFGGREPVRGDLGIASRTLCRGKPHVGLSAPALSVRPLGENVALRAFGGDELLVQSRRHRRELRGGVAFGALPWVHDARETRQHEQTTRR